MGVAIAAVVACWLIGVVAVINLWARGCFTPRREHLTPDDWAAIDELLRRSA